MITIYSILQSMTIISIYFFMVNILYPLGTTNSTKIFQEPEPSYLLEYNILSLRKQKHKNNIPFRTKPFLKIGMLSSNNIEAEEHKLNLLVSLIISTLETNNIDPRYTPDEIAIAGLSIPEYRTNAVKRLDKDIIKVWLKIIRAPITEGYEHCISDFLDYRLNIILGLDISLPSAIIISILGKHAGAALLEAEKYPTSTDQGTNITTYYPMKRNEIMEKYGITKDIFQQCGIILF